MEHPSKRPALESNVLNGGPQGPKPYNHVDDEITARLQNVPRGIRESVSKGYSTQPSAPIRPADKEDTLPIFRSAKEDIRWSLDLISPTRHHELKPLYETFDANAEPLQAGNAGFPRESAERKRRVRDTSPSSSPENSPAPSPLPAPVDAQGDTDMDAAPATLAPPDAMPTEREIRPWPRRTMSRTVQSAPAGGLRFGAGTQMAEDAIQEEDDSTWTQVDFSAFARRTPE